MIAVVLLALVAHVGYALADFSGAVGARKFSSRAMSLMAWVAGVLIYFVLAPFLLDLHFYLWPVLVAAFTGVLFAIVFPLFLIAVEKGNATLGGVVAGTFPFWIVILSIIFYDETLTYAQTGGIALIIVGIVLSALHLTRKTRLHNLLNKYTFLALLVSLLWGIGYTIYKYPVDKLGWFETGFINSIVGTITSIVWLYPKLKGKLSIIIKRHWRFPLLNALYGVTATLAYGFALTKGNSSIVGPLAGSYSGLYAILSYFKFKETLTKLQVLGVIIIVIGIITLSYFSV